MEKSIAQHTADLQSADAHGIPVDWKVAYTQVYQAAMNREKQLMGEVEKLKAELAGLRPETPEPSADDCADPEETLEVHTTDHHSVQLVY